MSKIEVNAIEPQCGTTLTLGASGDTVTIPSGATISNLGTAAGFGSTGEVSWDTTKKTTGFTATSGVGYFCDTTSAAFTVTLPATPSAGNVVAVSDYNGTASTNNITVGRNSSNINGGTEDYVISKSNSSVQFIYIDATVGWQTVFTGNTSDTTNPFIAATGGTVTCCGDYKIHTFTSPGTFTVTNAGSGGGSNTVDYLVVAGGGGGSDILGGAGGAGGYRESSGAASGCYTRSPLGACVSALPVTVTGYPITVGGGGSNGQPGSTGSNSVFSTITSNGGGGGGRAAVGLNGGSGGGGHAQCAPGAAGSGNTPPVSPPQGNNGGPNSSTLGGGAGGGATAVGSPQPGPAAGGAGAGTGINPSTCVGTPGPNGALRYFAGGGGGSRYATPTCSGSIGPGGVGGGGASVEGPASVSGTANTGGGGGGSSYPYVPGPTGGAGGSRIVIIRYKYQ